MRVLILGGTAEARRLAAALSAEPGISVTSSLAGRVSNPALPVGAVRIGGFGGAGGLAAFLLETSIDVMVDATHPFAATISAHAATAAAETGVPLLGLRRPGWTAADGDDWRRVPSITAAAAALDGFDGTVFLTTGRRDLGAFADDTAHRFVIRTVEPPDPPLPPDHSLVLDRGPYTVDGELALLRSHDVRVVVTKDSGGALTVAKLTAARALGLPVVMVDRPPYPRGVATVDSVAAALATLRPDPR